MQIDILAGEIGVPVSCVKKYLRERGFETKSRTLRGPAITLTSDEVEAVRHGHARGEVRRDRLRTDDISGETPIDPHVSSDDVSALPSVVVRGGSAVARGKIRFPVFVHQDFYTWLYDPASPVEQRRIVTRRIQELMALGRPTQLKGVKGVNQGWLRTAVGGNGGFHHYLWLTHRGERMRKQTDKAEALFSAAPEGARFLRAVRHHDETSERIEVGTFADYVEFTPQTALASCDDGLVDSLVSAQRAVASDPARVRVLIGQPGAGKTTSLQAAASNLSGRVLYVTFSSDLADRARAWLDAFGPDDVEVVVWTFRDLLRRLDPERSLGETIARANAVRILADALEPHVGQLKAWCRDGQLRVDELYSELHAHLFGGALPVTFRGKAACVTACMVEADYRTARAGLGKAALDGALLAASKLDDATRRLLFPEPVGAFERALALTNRELELDADTFGFDWVLVDEIQDLTLAELWLMVDVTARAGVIRGVNPGMIVAGDEAQTVRPTAFEFAVLSALVDARLAARTDRKDHNLTVNLRSPSAIAGTILALRSALYRLLPRGNRPHGQRSESPADVTQGRVLQVEVADEQALRRVMEIFATNRAEAALVYPGTLVPAPIEALAREFELPIWTSESIKGLEFRIVGVLDVTDSLQRIERLATSAKAEHLCSEVARSAIDRFVVACSRSTETLVLLGSGWRESTSSVVRDLFAMNAPVDEADQGALPEGQLGLVDIEHLGGVVESDGADAVAQVGSLLEQSEHAGRLGDHDTALRLALNAVGFLGEAGRPGAVGAELRQAARRRAGQAYLAKAVHLNEPALIAKAATSFRAAGDGEIGKALTALSGVLTKPFTETDACKRLVIVVESIATLEAAPGGLASTVLAALVAHATMVAGTDGVPREPAGREALLTGLDRLAQVSLSDRTALRAAHQAVLARTLRHVCIHPDKNHRREYQTLRAGLVDAATLADLDATHAEACGELRDAVELWRSLGRIDDALRCARAIPDLALSAELAEAGGSRDARRLAWARDVDALLAAAPGGDLNDKELVALRSLAERVFAARANPRKR